MRAQRMAVWTTRLGLVAGVAGIVLGAASAWAAFTARYGYEPADLIVYRAWRARAYAGAAVAAVGCGAAAIAIGLRALRSAWFRAYGWTVPLFAGGAWCACVTALYLAVFEFREGVPTPLDRGQWLELMGCNVVTYLMWGFEALGLWLFGCWFASVVLYDLAARRQRAPSAAPASALEGAG